MYKKIKGKIYDTETSQLIYKVEYGFRDDVNYIGEFLYRTHEGDFFLHNIIRYIGTEDENDDILFEKIPVKREYIEPMEKGSVIAWLSMCDGDDIVSELFPDKKVKE